ncbi:MAG: type II toxin-antitoxin system VapC family toxin [Candidatus Dormibacteria bacterium]
MDSSAIIKPGAAEPQTQALRDYLTERTNRISSALTRTEVQRAATRVSRVHLGLARRLLGDLELIELDQRLLDQAGQLSPPELRSLDAIHVATALSLGAELAESITYNQRQAAAAHEWAWL